MSSLQNNVRFTWQLVSQFVSWEFCRYMSELDENSSPETDVLSFLRNMIVQRTEKSVSEVTKHEIIAKFIMEIKAVKGFQISCIIPLSESVKKICPELGPAVNKLIHHVETFLNVLESTDESRKELIRLRIEDSINDFSKEASTLLPQPELLQVVDSWNHLHNVHPNAVKKVHYNAALFEKVLECIHFEGITPSEAKVIAVALAEDRVFEKHLGNAEAEPETEADSEQFSLSLQSSQPIYSQEFMKNARAEKTDTNCPLNHESPNFESPNIEASNQVPLHVDAFPVQVPDKFLVRPGDLKSGHNEGPPQLISAASPESTTPPPYPFVHRNVPNEDVELPNNETLNHMQFAQSSANESDELNSALHDHLHTKFQQLFNSRGHESDSDTSDCEKNPEFRFLTPTYFKKGTQKSKQIIWVSDQESNDSSILTNVGNSQKNDPNWSTKQPLLFASQMLKPTKKKTAAPKKRKIRQKKSNTKKKKLSNTESHTSIDSIYSKKKTVGPIHSSSDSDASIDNEANIPLRSEQRPSTSSKPTEAELNEGCPKRIKTTKKLYRSPNVSIDDFVTLRRPASATPVEVPVHRGTNTVATKKKPEQSENTSVKKQKCKQCSKAFKTQVALRRHIFLHHTEPPDPSDRDSDCDP